MANPNIAAANSILGNTGVATLTTSLVTLFTVPSNTVYKINSITVANKCRFNGICRRYKRFLLR